MSSCPRLASLLALAFTAATQAYIPAQPGSSGPLSGTAHREELYLGIQWYPQIFLTAPIRRQALGSAHSVNDTVPMLRGAVVQFTESDVLDGYTVPPWIALVSCDANATDASPDVDIFRLAYERGAIAVVLYAITADYCTLNSGWNDGSANQTTSLDVYTTLSRDVIGLILFQFHATNPSYTMFDSTLLNHSSPSIKDAISLGQPVALMHYSLGTLWMGNVSGTGTYGGGWLEVLMWKADPTPPEIIAVIIATSVLGACAFMIMVWTFANRLRLKIRRVRDKKAGTLDLPHEIALAATSTRYPAPPTLPIHFPHDPPVDDAASSPPPSDANATIHTYQASDKRSAVTTLVADTLSGIAPSTIPPSYYTSYTAAPSYHTRRLSHQFQSQDATTQRHADPTPRTRPAASTPIARQVIKKDRRLRKGAAKATATAIDLEPARRPLALQCASASFTDSTRSEDNTGASQNPPSESVAEMDASRRRSRVHFAPLEHVSEGSDVKL